MNSKKLFAQKSKDGVYVGASNLGNNSSPYMESASYDIGMGSF